MKYIEFLGAGGSGKTTLLNELTSSEEYFGGAGMFDVKRWHKKYSPVLSTLPPRARRKIGEVIWWNHFKSIYSVNFIHENTCFFKKAIEYTERAKYNNGLDMMMDAMSKHQLGRDIVKETEYFCLDEGFYHKTAIIAKYGGIPSHSYFDAMPKPDILVYVDVPLEVARSRVISRDGSALPKKANQRGRQVKLKLLDVAEKTKTDVVEIQNTGPPAENAIEIQTKIRQLQL